MWNMSIYLWWNKSCFLCFKIRHSLVIFQSRADLSLNSAPAKLAICTWRPFIFRRPICGTHGALSGLDPRLGSRPISARGRDKKTSFIEEPFPSSFFPLRSLFGLQTELNSAAAHTWRPIHRTGHILLWGQQAGAHVTPKSNTTMVLASFPPFLSPPTHLSHAPFFSVWVQWTEPGNIYFALVVVNSSDWKSRNEHANKERD